MANNVEEEPAGIGTGETLEFNFLDLIKDEAKMSMILILMTYESLNLRQIATVMGLSEPSCHAHVKKLLDDDFIELDPTMADRRGKYYRLNPLVEESMKKQEEEFEGVQMDGEPEYYQNMAVMLRSLALISQRMGTYAASYLEQRAEELSENYKKKKKEGLPASAIVNGQLTYTSVASKQEVEEINETFNAFVSKVMEINSRNKDLSSSESYETIMISGLILPLKRMDPRN